MDQVHLKDFAVLNNEPIWTELGQGNLNMPAILTACKAAGVRDYLVEQDECPITKNPFQSLEISLDYLHGLGLQ
jgi:sugar phosphate isomerase/epimerase